MGRQRNKERALVKSFVVLMRNTTWRCGKLERSIVQYLHKRRQNFGKRGMCIDDIMVNMNLEDDRQNELLDAIKRLEKRKIVMLSPV